MAENPYYSIISAQSDDLIATLSLIVLSRNFFYKHILILSYSMLKLVKIECHLHGKKNRPAFQNFQNPNRFIILANG